MAQIAATSVGQGSLGFENLVGLGLQGSRRRSESGADKAKAEAASGELTAEQQRQVDELKKIDRKVHAHEQAHLAVGADLVRGGASYTYETGPDRNRYAVAGEVSIDTTPGRTPEDTIPKAQHIRATALAPVDPSPQDHSVAAQAARMESDARLEVAAKRNEAPVEPARETGSLLYGQAGRESGRTSRIGGVLDSFA
ncbi:MAG: hypothetical protein HY777_11720 [Betaproteobacteria bacterium]|nr:hypothetical protein [Betaproteobacteria bacterium]